MITATYQNPPPSSVWPWPWPVPGQWPIAGVPPRSWPSDETSAPRWKSQSYTSPPCRCTLRPDWWYHLHVWDISVWFLYDRKGEKKIIRKNLNIHVFMPASQASFLKPLSHMYSNSVSEFLDILLKKCAIMRCPLSKNLDLPVQQFGEVGTWHTKVEILIESFGYDLCVF